MKTSFPLLLLFILSAMPGISQVDENPPINFVLFISPEDDPDGLKGKSASVKIELKDKDGIVGYTENHTVTLGKAGLAEIRIGTGDGQVPPYTFVNLLAVDNVCYTVITDDFPAVMGSTPILATVRGLYAEDARKIAGIPYVPDLIPFGVIKVDPQDYAIVMQKKKGGTDTISPAPMSGLFNYGMLPSAQDTSTSMPYSHVGDGSGRAQYVFGQNTLTQLESQVTFCGGPLNGLYNVLEVKNVQSRSAPLDYPTASIYAENIMEPLGVGLFANGAARGSYHQGQTGLISLTLGPGNGSATWARVQSAPAAGGYKYGLLGEDQNFPDAWAAAIFGRGFYTGSWSQTSDRRLKTAIRNTTHHLDLILQLRPSMYRYVQNTPYNLPEGEHFGFIAQDVEDVLPNLVSDVVMPKHLDPDRLDAEGTETFKAINYTELIPILTGAIQELNARVEAQAREIETLKKALTQQPDRK